MKNRGIENLKHFINRDIKYWILVLSPGRFSVRRAARNISRELTYGVCFGHCWNGVFNVLFVGRKNFNNIESHAGGDFMAFLFPSPVQGFPR